MSYPSDRLVAEHRLIIRMLAVIDKAAALSESGKAVEPQIFLKAVDFIRNFADRFHHAKEEDIFFKEDNILYPLGNKVFTAEDQQLIEQAFNRLEEETAAENIYQKYLNLVEELEGQFGSNV
jgi:hemerythrin-like domain-containing protein